MSDIVRWIGHSRMSDPGNYATIVSELSSDVGYLNRTIQGVLLHSDWLSEYGLDESHRHAAARQTLPVADRIADILGRDARSLRYPRPPDKRSIGTCRDFALMLCSLLRSKGTPSRLRCGFAAYFGGAWEDHWVCEYWDSSAQAWRLSDPQIDGMLRSKYCIGFDASDIPRQSFVTAGQAWMDCRAGKSDPNLFGHGEVTGLWFVGVNVVRDHYVLNGREVSAWDHWRDAPTSMRVISERGFALLDDLAGFPEHHLIEVDPDWLA